MTIRVGYSLVKHGGDRSDTSVISFFLDISPIWLLQEKTNIVFYPALCVILQPAHIDLKTKKLTRNIEKIHSGLTGY